MSRTFFKIAEGFGDRAWLTPDEWVTYRRRWPVRYPKALKQELIDLRGEVCVVCGKGPLGEANPLQIAHRVPFASGVVDWGLTPDWLDQLYNTDLAHTKGCNAKCGLKRDEVPQFLRDRGLDLAHSPAVQVGHVVVRQVDGVDKVSFDREPVPTEAEPQAGYEQD